MTRPAGLIERLEKAKRPDRRLDEEIYRAVIDEFAPSFKQYKGMVWGNADKGVPVRCYTASIDAALTLVPEGFNWTVDGFPDGPACASVYMPNDDGPCSGLCDGATPTIALCIAALKARTPALTQPTIGPAP